MFNDIFEQLVILFSLSGLHYSNNHCINYILSLQSYLLLFILLFLCLLSFLLLMGLSWYKIDSHIIVGEGSIHLDFLIGLKFRVLLIFLGQDLLLWITQISEAIVHVSFRNCSQFFYLAVAQFLVPIEQTQYDSLETGCDENVVFLTKSWS